MRIQPGSLKSQRGVVTRLVLSAIILASLSACDAGDPNAPDELAPVAAQSSALTDSLEAYSQKCNQATGTTVPDFVCDSGTEVPVTNFIDGKCDRPNRLNQVCDPGSKFQVLTNTADAAVVAHCRKKNNAAGQFGDIAV